MPAQPDKRARIIGNNLIFVGSMAMRSRRHERQTQKKNSIEM